MYHPVFAVTLGFTRPLLFKKSIEIRRDMLIIGFTVGVDLLIVDTGMCVATVTVVIQKFYIG